MTVEKIYLHIGFPKVGSTAVQDHLFCNKKLLEMQGILYPDAGIYWHGHHSLAGSFQSPDVRLDWVGTDEAINYIDALRSEAQACKARVIFLSSEAFSYSINKESLQRLRNDLSSISPEIEVICFLRRQDVWVESAFTQAYKSARTPFDFWGYIKEREELFYDDFLFMWESVFGMDHFKPILIDKEYGFTNVLDPICSLLGIAPPSSHEMANERLAIDALHFSYHWHLHKGCLLNGKLVHDLGEYSNLFPGSRKYTFFKPNERESFLRKFEEDNKKIALRYFSRDRLFSTEDPFKDCAYVDTKKTDPNIMGPVVYLLEKHACYETRGPRKQETASIWHPDQKCKLCCRLLRDDVCHNCLSQTTINNA